MMDDYMHYIDMFCTSISTYVNEHPEHQYAVCRGTEIHKLLKIMTSYPIKYPVLVGEPHTENDLIRGLARKISIGDLDEFQATYINSGLYKINWSKLAKDEHEYSDFKKLLKQCVSWAALHSSSEYNVIIVIDGHIFKDTRLRKILIPFINEGLIQVIFVFTEKEYKRYVESWHWFTKKIDVVYERPLVMDQMIQAVAVNIPGYELRYGVKIPSHFVDIIMDYCIDNDTYMTCHAVRAFKMLDLLCNHISASNHSKGTAADISYVIKKLKLHRE